MTGWNRNELSIGLGLAWKSWAWFPPPPTGGYGVVTGRFSHGFRANRSENSSYHQTLNFATGSQQWGPNYQLVGLQLLLFNYLFEWPSLGIRLGRRIVNSDRFHLTTLQWPPKRSQYYDNAKPGAHFQMEDLEIIKEPLLMDGLIDWLIFQMSIFSEILANLSQGIMCQWAHERRRPGILHFYLHVVAGWIQCIQIRRVRFPRIVPREP